MAAGCVHLAAAIGNVSMGKLVMFKMLVAAVIAPSTAVMARIRRSANSRGA